MDCVGGGCMGKVPVFEADTGGAVEDCVDWFIGIRIGGDLFCCLEVDCDDTTGVEGFRSLGFVAFSVDDDDDDAGIFATAQ